MNHFEKVQNYLEGLGLLTLKGVSKLDTTSLRALILDFLIQNAATCTIDSKGYEQCSFARRRSFGDIYRILKSYKKDLTVEQLYNTFSEMSKDKTLYSAVCGTIHRRIWELRLENTKRWFVDGDTDELSLEWSGHVRDTSSGKSPALHTEVYL